MRSLTPLFIMTMFLTACAAAPQLQENPAPLVGGDRDEHGCIGSAGYAWCAAKQKCLRPWEEECFDSAYAAILWELSQKYADRQNTFTVIMDAQDERHARARVSFSKALPQALPQALSGAEGSEAEGSEAEGSGAEGSGAEGSEAEGSESGTPGGMILASKMTGIWRIVYEGNGSVDCTVLRAEEFPQEMLVGFCD